MTDETKPPQEVVNWIAESPNAVGLREYIEALMLEKQHAAEIADERLRAYVDGKVETLGAQIVAAEKYGIERANKLTAMIEANTREARIVQAATQAAVEKAEQAQLRVNESQNEFRGQLSDQAGTLMPRKESEARHEESAHQIDGLRADIAQLRTELAVGPPGLSELSRTTLHREGRDEARQATQTQQLTLLGVLAAIALVVVDFFTRKH